MFGKLEEKLHRNFKLTKDFKFQKRSRVGGERGIYLRSLWNKNNNTRPICGEVADEMKADSKASLIASCRKTTQNDSKKSFKSGFTCSFLYCKTELAQLHCPFNVLSSYKVWLFQR